MIPYSALFLQCINRDFPLTMALSLDDIQRIAHLARIEITPAEAAEVGKKLDGIFELIGRMRAVDTTGIVPMSHAQDVMLPLREDRVTETDRRDALPAPGARGSGRAVPGTESHRIGSRVWPRARMRLEATRGTPHHDHRSHCPTCRGAARRSACPASS